MRIFRCEHMFLSVSFVLLWFCIFPSELKSAWISQSHQIITAKKRGIFLCCKLWCSKSSRLCKSFTVWTIQAIVKFIFSSLSVIIFFKAVSSTSTTSTTFRSNWWFYIHILGYAYYYYEPILWLWMKFTIPQLITNFITKILLDIFCCSILCSVRCMEFSVIFSYCVPDFFILFYDSLNSIREFIYPLYAGCVYRCV